jgi:hypothetical protein
MTRYNKNFWVETTSIYSHLSSSTKLSLCLTLILAQPEVAYVTREIRYIE